MGVQQHRLWGARVTVVEFDTEDPSSFVDDNRVARDIQKVLSDIIEYKIYLTKNDSNSIKLPLLGFLLHLTQELLIEACRPSMQSEFMNQDLRSGRLHNIECRLNDFIQSQKKRIVYDHVRMMFSPVEEGNTGKIVQSLRGVMTRYRNGVYFEEANASVMSCCNADF